MQCFANMGPEETVMDIGETLICNSLGILIVLMVNFCVTGQIVLGYIYLPLHVFIYNLIMNISSTAVENSPELN